MSRRSASFIDLHPAGCASVLVPSPVGTWMSPLVCQVEVIVWLGRSTIGPTT